METVILEGNGKQVTSRTLDDGRFELYYSYQDENTFCGWRCVNIKYYKKLGAVAKKSAKNFIEQGIC